jgi:hypothetical protein
MKRFLIGACIGAAACGAWAQALPSVWVDVPFGTYSAAYAGGSSYEAGTFTVAGSGNDMWGAANDGGRFVFQPLLGDCEVIANVKRPTDAGLGSNARAGVLLRQQNNRGSLHMLFARLRGDDTTNIGRVSASGRLALGANPTAKSENGHVAEWMLMRLVRQGDTVRAYLNTNAVWELYHTLTVPMGEAVNAGLFVSRHSASANPLMTNDFDTVTVQPLVSVQTNAAGGVEVAWVTDLPGIDAAWAAGYTYQVTRTPDGGTPEAVAQDLATAAWTDDAPQAGVLYRYSVTAVPLPDEPLTPPANALIGTSGPVRLPHALDNLMSGLDQGLFAGYYAPTGAALPSLTRVESSTANVAAAQPEGFTNNFRTAFNASLQVETTDIYTFFSQWDDGVRLTVGDALVMDNWYGGAYEASSAPVWLEAGRCYPVRVDYYQNTGGRACTLAWRRAGDPAVTAAVPASAFAPVPLPWRHESIGDVTFNGNADFDLDTGAVTVTAAGNALTNGADACHLVSQAVAGDFDLTVRLDSLTGDSPERRAGVACRADLTSGAAGLALVAVPDVTTYDVVVLTRAAAGAVPAETTLATGVATGDPLWLRLTRVGLAVTARYSADGVAWTTAGTGLVPAAFNAQACLLASSADPASAATAVFGAVTAAAPAAASLAPTEDAYVRSDNLNYGAATEIVCKRDAGSTQRETFLRFDVAGYTGVRSAVLRLYVQNRPPVGTPIDVTVRALTDLDWDEMAVTWNNAPGGLPMPTVFLAPDDPQVVTRVTVPATGAYLEADVTPAVQAAAGSGDLTLDLFSMLPHATPVSFASKEHATPALRPALIVSYEVPQRVTTDSGPAAGEVTVQWAAFPQATAYRVYRADNVDGAYAQTGSDTAERRFKDASLTVGQTYFYKVAAVTPSGETPLSAAVAGTAAASVATLSVDEDAHVNGGASANMNYGSSATLTIKYNATDQNYHREAYLLFNDITGLAHVARAVLKVVPTTASPGDPATIPVQFIRMPSNDWSEATVTFNNPPPGYPPPTPRLTSEPESDRVTVPATAVGATMAVDVTEIVRKAARVNADSRLSIGVIRLDNTGSFNLSLASSEHGTAAYRPKLEYVLGRPVAPDVATGNGYAALSWPPYRGATGYVVRRADAAAGPYVTLTNTADTAFKDLTADEGTLHFYTLAAVTVGGESEVSLPARARVLALERRYPVADTYIESNGGATETTNHGNDQTLNLKVAPRREDFFKFDVTGLADAGTVRFRVCASTPHDDFTSARYVVHYGDFGDWNETGVTYAAPPPNYAPPTVTTGAKGARELARIFYEYPDPAKQYVNYLEADVTDAVRAAAQAGKRYLTIQMTGDDSTFGGDGAAYINIRTKEYGDALRRPVLLCSASPFGAPAGLRAEPRPELPGWALSWRPVNGADHYIVLRQGPQDEAPVVVDGHVTGTSLTDSDPAFWNDRDYTYTVIAVAADGTPSPAAAVTQSLTRSFVVPAAADTFVRAGDYTNTSYAQSALVEIKGDPDLGFQREGFFRFAVTNLPAFASAKLRLRLRLVNTFTDSTVALFETNDTGWVESGEPAPTWNSVLGEGAGRTAVPDAPALIAAFNLQASGYQPGDDMFFDITPQLRAAQARSAETLMVQMVITTLNAQGNIVVQSLQGPDLEAVPALICTVGKRPALGTLMLLH